MEKLVDLGLAYAMGIAQNHGPTCERVRERIHA